MFNNHFKTAWLQSPEYLTVIGNGSNCIPTVHVNDVANLVKTISINKPEQKYLLAVDGTIYSKNKSSNTQ